MEAIIVKILIGLAVILVWLGLDLVISVFLGRLIARNNNFKSDPLVTDVAADQADLPASLYPNYVKIKFKNGTALIYDALIYDDPEGDL